MIKLNLNLIDLMYEWNPAFEFPQNIIIKKTPKIAHIFGVGVC